jgi:hypothetical protein
VSVLVLMVWFGSVVSYSPTSAGGTEGGAGGVITPQALRTSQLVCCGALGETRLLSGVQPWWKAYFLSPDIGPYESLLAVDDVISGDDAFVGQRIKVRYPATIPPDRGGHGAGSHLVGLANRVGTRRALVCLARHPGDTDSFYILRSDEYMLLGKRADGPDWIRLAPDKRFVRELVSAVRDADDEVALMAMIVAWRSEAMSPSLDVALCERKYGTSRWLAGTAVQTLTRRGDIRTIYELDDFAKKGILGPVGEVRQPEAVPALVQLARSSHPETHGQAIKALRMIRSPKGASTLGAGLDDCDEWVRYDAIMGLAALTDHMNPQWAWGFDHFRENPKELTDKWKAWWEKEGKSQYPSVETVLKEYEETKRKLEAERKPVAAATGPRPPEAPAPSTTLPDPQPTAPVNPGRTSGGLLLVICGFCAIAGLAAYIAMKSRKRGKVPADQRL